MDNTVDSLAVNTIRLLAADATYNSGSGHPGAPMGMAPAAHVLFTEFLNCNPKNPHWLNRDRFVLSNGHGCMLQYAILHLLGYDITLDDLKSFRALGSKTPGHPEAHHTPGVEVTTGPLGQGICNAVGLAMAQAHTAAIFNRPSFDLINNYTYCFLGDGCLMEGISGEASSLAGHFGLGNLICIWDDNRICIDGDTGSTFTEDVVKRYEAYGWHVVAVEDGDNDLDAIKKAIQKCREVRNRPSLIRLRTTIGYGSLKQGTAGVHGSPLKIEDIRQLKSKFGFEADETFVVPQAVRNLYGNRAAEGSSRESQWKELLERYKQQFPTEHADLERRLKGELPHGWEKQLPRFTPKDASVATRKLSELCLNSISAILPELLGGSADLTSSNLTRFKDAVDFQSEKASALGNFSGRYIRYGVREHGMGAIMNGLAAYGTIIPYGGTFLNFVSYAAGAVRLSALSGTHVIWVATHDSIALGGDGPTHQPIETLAHFRALPNCLTWRPADGNETSAAYYVAVTSRTMPSIIALSRQDLPQLEGSSLDKAARGGYVVVEATKAQVTLVSTGSEVTICVEAAKALSKDGIACRVVSLPCFEIFDSQSTEYKLSVLPDDIPIMSVEALSTVGWDKFSHEHFGLDRFGASGPAQDLYEKFDFTPQGVCKRAVATIQFYKDIGKIRSPIRRAF